VGGNFGGWRPKSVQTDKGTSAQSIPGKGNGRRIMDQLAGLSRLRGEQGLSSTRLGLGKPEKSGQTNPSGVLPMLYPDQNLQKVEADTGQKFWPKRMGINGEHRSRKSMSKGELKRWEKGGLGRR